MHRHLVIPDTQIRPGAPIEHIRWAAEAILEYRPDYVAMIGDWFDLPSLSMHEGAGSRHSEGQRLREDIDAGNEAFYLLDRLIKGKFSKKWTPERDFYFGNHEHRLPRAIDSNPKYDGMFSLDDLHTPGFRRIPFLKIKNVDGIKYCHYFPNPYSGRPIGGTIVNRLNHIGSSFVQGHQQGFLYASKQYPDHVKHGVVCGRFYLHYEHYRPDDVQHAEWNGLVVLNGVANGDFDLMPLRMDYLRRKYS